MFAQIVRRLAIAVPTLLAIIAAAFVLLHAAPDGPFGRDRQVSPETERRLEAAFAPRQNVVQQLVLYISGVMRGDLGPSMQYEDKDVADLFAEGLPTSALLAGSALVIALGAGVGLGAFAALRRDRPHDRAVRIFILLGACIPALALAPVLAFLFGVQWHWLPAGGLHRDEFGVSYLVLPVVTLALPQTALAARIMRARMIEALNSDAALAARARGLREREVIWRHAFPTAIAPASRQLGPMITGVVVGTLVVETVFQLPGAGRQFVTAALARDYPTVMGGVIVYAALVLVLRIAAAASTRTFDLRAGRA
ncbi:MAG TPA: ABC transporter permease [Caulobacterales bacterium]|nr:ABC transporter permease [Caulobacterales bacterium]